MTKQIVAVDTAADTFQVFINRVNELIAASNTEYMTANTNANGSVSIGNSYLQGILFATTLCTTGLRGGNVQSSAALTISSNVAMANTLNWLIGNTTVNVAINSSSVSISGRQLQAVHGQVNVRTTGTSAQEVDNILKADYRGAEYVITVADNAANGFLMTKALVFHDSGADAYLSEYGTMWSNTNLGTFTANANSTHIRMYITPTVANSQVKATKTVVAL